MDDRTFLRHVADIGGLGGERDARRAVRATLVALASSSLPRDAAALVARGLPRRIGRAFAAQVVPRDPSGPPPTPDELYARVERVERVGPGFAREHAQIVCRAIAEDLAPDERARLADDVGPRLAALFSTRAPGDESGRPPATAPPGRTHPLATARPGSSHAVATARPGSEHPLSEAAPPDRAQSESVVRASNPHAAEKISSARG